jgi:iron-sulfur cluster repair protein YtfE (RIC family)
MNDAFSALQATPDDGHRLSPVAAWDETTRPRTRAVRRSPAPTERGLRAAQSLLDVHAGLRDQLADIRELADQVLAGTVSIGAARSVLNSMAVRQSNWSLGAYCATYCTLVAQHHYGEDEEIFPYLRRREGELSPVLDRLEAEHVAIHDLLDRIDQALVTLVDGQSAATEQLRAVIDLFTDALLSHLSYEERELLQPMAEQFG